MPTDKPRVNVVISPEQHRLLLSLGRSQGRSAASYVRELLDGVEPYLRHMLELEEARAQSLEEYTDKVRSISASVLEDTIAANQGNLFGDLAELASYASSAPVPPPVPHSERERARKQGAGRKGKPAA